MDEVPCDGVISYDNLDESGVPERCMKKSSVFFMYEELGILAAYCKLHIDDIVIEEPWTPISREEYEVARVHCR